MPSAISPRRQGPQAVPASVLCAASRLCLLRVVVDRRGDDQRAGEGVRDVTLCRGGKLHHIGIGRIHEGTRALHTVTGALLRELTLAPGDYQPTGKPKGPTRLA